jgi:hypothetical protein
MNCFPTNNIKTSKEHIEKIHSDELYCNYANDIWDKSGKIYRKLIISDSIRVDIYDNTGPNEWDDSTEPLHMGKINFFDREKNLINVDIKKIEILEISKSGVYSNGNMWRKMGNHSKWNNTLSLFDYEDTSSKYIVQNNANFEITDSKKRASISFFFSLREKKQISFMKLISAETSGKDPEEIRVSLGKNYTELINDKNKNNTVVFKRQKLQLNVSKKITDFLEFENIETITSYENRRHERKQTNLFVFDSFNNIIQSNNHANFYSMKKSLFNRRVEMHQNLLKNKDKQKLQIFNESGLGAANMIENVRQFNKSKPELDNKSIYNSRIDNTKLLTVADDSKQKIKIHEITHDISEKDFGNKQSEIIPTCFNMHQKYKYVEKTIVKQEKETIIEKETERIHRVHVIGRGDSRPDIYKEKDSSYYVSIYTNNSNPKIFNFGNTIYIEFEMEEELSDQSYIKLFVNEYEIGTFGTQRYNGSWGNSRYIYRTRITTKSLFYNKNDITYNSKITFKIRPVTKDEIYKDIITETTDDSYVVYKDYEYISIYTLNDNNEKKYTLEYNDDIYIYLKLNNILDYDDRNEQDIRSELLINIGNGFISGGKPINKGPGEYLFHLVTNILGYTNHLNQYDKNKYNNFNVKFILTPVTLNNHDKYSKPNMHSITDYIKLDAITHDDVTDESSLTIKV